MHQRWKWIATFFTLPYLRPNTKQGTKSGMRNAITGTFTVTSLMALGLFLFFHGGDDPLNPVTDALVKNFTLLMGVVMASYFGTTTYEKVAQVRAVVANPARPMRSTQRRTRLTSSRQRNLLREPLGPFAVVPTSPGRSRR